MNKQQKNTNPMASLQDVRKDIELILSKIKDLEKELGNAGTSGDAEAVRCALNGYIQSLEKLYRTALATVTVEDSDDPVEIPVDVVEFVDQGKNPDECMRLIMSSVLQRAQQAKGKSSVFQVLKQEHMLQ